MTPKELMEYLIDQGYSKYRIAKVMDMQPIMVDRFLKEDVKTMRKEAAERLRQFFEVTVDDEYINGEQKRMWVDKDNVLRAD